MIKKHLSNGVRVVLEKIDSCRSVSFGIWVKTGSRNEKPELNGISHFIEHMLFKGTERYSTKEIAEVFDGIGGNVNAFTTKEYTCYYAKVLDEHLPIAIDVLSDMFFHSKLDENELAKERNVILEEISMYEDTPDDLVHDLLAKASYGEHPLGYPILGTEHNLNAMTSDTLRNYMDNHYTIENTVIGVAGNIDDGILDLLEKHFGTLGTHSQQQAGEAPVFVGDSIYHHKKTEQNHICLSLPGMPLSHSHYYAMILLNNSIGGGMSSRLFQEIREKRGLAYSVYSYHNAHMDSGLFTIYMGTAPKQTEEVLKVTMDILGELAAKGITENELRKGKEQLKGSLILSLESTSSRMNRLGKNEMMLGKHYTIDEVIERIEGISLKQIQQVINDLCATPFALSMVGQSDTALQQFRRDQLVAKRAD